MKRSPKKQGTFVSQLTDLALSRFFHDVGPEFAKQYRLRLRAQLRKLYAERDQLGKGVLEQVRDGNGTRISNLLRTHLGIAALRAWAQRYYADLAEQLGSAELDRAISSWISRNPKNLKNGVLEAAIRYQVNPKSREDHVLIQSTLGTHLQGIKEVQMATAAAALKVTFDKPVYTIDIDGIPPGVIPTTTPPTTPQMYADDYEQYVDLFMRDRLQIPADAKNKTVYAAIIGSLLLDEYFDTSAQGFNDSISNAWLQVQKGISDSSGQPIQIVPPLPEKPFPLTGAYLYSKIDEAISTSIRRDNHDTAGFYQEFALAGRRIIESGKGSLLHDQTTWDYFITAVRLALDAYVSGAPDAGSLELPPLSDPSGGDSEIVAENVRAVSMIYAAYELEQVKLIQVIERTVEVWSNGQLAVNFGPAGKALDRWYWDSFERMTDAARMMQFTRVLGAKGGEVSKEVLPNNNFNDLLLRFLSSLSEYDRQTRIADIVGSTRAGNVSDAQVRKAGRDLAANMSLYGWGGTQFAARRLNSDIANAVGIVQMPEIQKAWGVQSAWQVVERVCTQEFNFTPNVVKYRTMAESGKAILDMVAKYYNKWGSTTNNPLFCTKYDGSGCSSGYDIGPDDQRTLMRHTEYWLAVNGIKDQQVVDNAEPSDTAYSPSIPTLEPASTNGSGGAIAEQLKQMVQQGQTPTLEQIQKMIPVAKAGG
jgi:hypothetical protein